jgi:hypothetical protein
MDWPRLIEESFLALFVLPISSYLFVRLLSLAYFRSKLQYFKETRKHALADALKVD